MRLVGKKLIIGIMMRTVVLEVRLPKSVPQSVLQLSPPPFTDFTTVFSISLPPSPPVPDGFESEDSIRPIPISPRKPKWKPGPRREPISAVTRAVPVSLGTPSRARRSTTVKFKLGVLSWAHHTRIDDGCGGLRAPTREEVRKKFGLKSVTLISRWRRVRT